MRRSIGSKQRPGGARRQGRHKALPAWRARAPRLRVLALVPLALAGSLVTANALAGRHSAPEVASSLVVTVAPAVAPAPRPPDDPAGRAARAAPRTPAPAVSRP